MPCGGGDEHDRLARTRPSRRDGRSAGRSTVEAFAVSTAIAAMLGLGQARDDGRATVRSTPSSPRTMPVKLTIAPAAGARRVNASSNATGSIGPADRQAHPPLTGGRKATSPRPANRSGAADQHVVERDPHLGIEQGRDVAPRSTAATIRCRVNICREVNYRSRVRRSRPADGRKSSTSSAGHRHVPRDRRGFRCGTIAKSCARACCGSRPQWPPPMHAGRRRATGRADRPARRHPDRGRAARCRSPGPGCTTRRNFRCSGVMKPIRPPVVGADIARRAAGVQRDRSQRPALREPFAHRAPSAHAGRSASPRHRPAASPR